MRQQAFAGVFHQIQHLLKPIRPPVVGVRDHRAVVPQTELGQAAHLGLVLRRATLLHQGQVVPVHHQDQIGVFKVRCAQGAGPQVGHRVTAPGGVLLLSLIHI